MVLAVVGSYVASLLLLLRVATSSTLRVLVVACLCDIILDSYNTEKLHRTDFTTSRQDEVPVIAHKRYLVKE